MFRKRDPVSNKRDSVSQKKGLLQTSPSFQKTGSRICKTGAPFWETRSRVRVTFFEWSPIRKTGYPIRVPLFLDFRGFEASLVIELISVVYKISKFHFKAALCSQF